MQLNIATYNIQHGLDHVAELEGVRQIDLDSIVDFMAEQRLDICAMNEVDWNCKRSEYINEPYLFAKMLTEKTGVKHDWAFAAGLVDALGPGSMYGNAIISRYPMQNVREIAVDVGVGRGGGYEPRSILAVDMEIEGKTLTVISTHFGLAHKEKLLALDVLRELVPSNPYPVIFMGDFNFWPTEEYYPEVAALLKDTSPDVALPLTFPSHAPNSKIDYIFASESLAVSDVHIEPVLYSDHLPLLAKLAW